MTGPVGPQLTEHLGDAVDDARLLPLCSEERFRLSVAVHEAGHAIAGVLLSVRVAKVNVGLATLPGTKVMSLGYTLLREPVPDSAQATYIFRWPMVRSAVAGWSTSGLELSRPGIRTGHQPPGS